MTSLSATHIGFIAADQWLENATSMHNLVRALRRLPDEESPRITLFCRRDATGVAEVSQLVDKIIVYQSFLDKRFGDTRYAPRAQRIDYTASSFLLRDSVPALGRAARRQHVDAMFPVQDPYNRLTPNPIAWIPHLRHRALPEQFSSDTCKAREQRFSALLADPRRHVVFSSRAALEQATQCYGTPKSTTHVLHFASVPTPEWFSDPMPVVARYGILSPFFIMCSQFRAHKDHITAFKAIAMLKRRGVKVNLVCTAPASLPVQLESLKAQVKILDIAPQVCILGTIPAADQLALMRASKAVLQPSRFEAWSTVIEDAHALAKPVIASDIPVHLEQNAPASQYFRTGDPGDFARAIAQFSLASEAPAPYPQPHQELRILEFARAFLDIVKSSCPAKWPRKQTSPSAAYPVEALNRRESA